MTSAIVRCDDAKKDGFTLAAEIRALNRQVPLVF